jgi:hypothetical protein
MNTQFGSNWFQRHGVAAIKRMLNLQVLQEVEKVNALGLFGGVDQLIGL